MCADVPCLFSTTDTTDNTSVLYDKLLQFKKKEAKRTHTCHLNHLLHRIYTNLISDSL